jgi:hypothetical protein
MLTEGGFLIAGAIVTIGGAALALWRRWAMERRLREQELSNGCVACGSSQVTVTADTRTCGACGYEGRRDGGGGVDPSELAGLHGKQPGDRGMF